MEFKGLYISRTCFPDVFQGSASLYSHELVTLSKKYKLCIDVVNPAVVISATGTNKINMFFVWICQLDYRQLTLIDGSSLVVYV